MMDSSTALSIHRRWGGSFFVFFGVVRPLFVPIGGRGVQPSRFVRPLCDNAALSEKRVFGLRVVFGGRRRPLLSICRLSIGPPRDCLLFALGSDPNFSDELEEALERPRVA